MYYMKYLRFKDQTVILYSKTPRFHYTMELDGTVMKLNTDSKYLEFEYKGIRKEIENFLKSSSCVICSVRKENDCPGVGMFNIYTNIYDIEFTPENIIYQLELLCKECPLGITMDDLHLSYGAAMVFNKMMEATTDEIEVFIRPAIATALEYDYGIPRVYTPYEESTEQRIFDIVLYSDLGKVAALYTVHSKRFSYEDRNTLIDRFCNRRKGKDEEIVKDLFSRYFREKQ